MDEQSFNSWRTARILCVNLLIFVILVGCVFSIFPNVFLYRSSTILYKIEFLLASTIVAFVLEKNILTKFQAQYPKLPQILYICAIVVAISLFVDRKIYAFLGLGLGLGYPTCDGAVMFIANTDYDKRMRKDSLFHLYYISADKYQSLAGNDLSVVGVVTQTRRPYGSNSCIAVVTRGEGGEMGELHYDVGLTEKGDFVAYNVRYVHNQ